MEPDALSATRPHPWEDPDVPDEQGCVFCDRCRRRVTLEERRRHRGGRGWERLVELGEGELSCMGSRRSQRPAWEREGTGQIWPQALVQTCVVHLIRNSMRYASWKDRKAIAAALRPIYTPATVEAAEQALEAFADSDVGRRAPASSTSGAAPGASWCPSSASSPGLSVGR